MSQPESKLSRQIMDALRRRGAFVWKNHGGATTMIGLPDIAGVYRGLMIAIETKMPGEESEVTTAQRRVHTKIRDAGGHVLAPCTSVRQAVQWLYTLDPYAPGVVTAGTDRPGPSEGAMRAARGYAADVIASRGPHIHTIPNCWCGETHHQTPM
jgi:hypothetical protein